jgi:outer membrane receptor for ferrienterochelin and colicins
MRLSGAGMLCACCALSWATPSSAQKAEEEDLALAYGDKSFVSIATGARLPVARAPAVATVITAEDIRAMGANDLDQVLETVPGLHVAVASSSFNPIYTIRGIYSDFNPHVLLLINGIPMKMIFNGNRTQLWAGMPVENISRIEVIRGPGSALYGADAFSGVINIITKTAAEIGGTQLGGRAGSFKTYDAWMQHGGKVGAADFALYLRAGNTDGQREIVKADRQTGTDAALGTRASLAPGPVNTGRDAYDAQFDLALDKWRLRGLAQVRRNVGSGTGVTQALDPTARQNSERYTFDLTYQDSTFAPDWDVSAQLSYHSFADEHDLTIFPPGTSFGPGRTFPDGVVGNPYKYEHHYRFGVSAFYTGAKDHRVRVGAGVDYLDMYKVRESKNFRSLSATNSTPVPLPGGVTDVTGVAAFLTPHDRTDVYAYIQDEWSIAKDWYLTAGVRHDNYSDFGSTTNPRAALVWEAAYNLTTKLLYGRAFRAPSFTDLYNINNPAFVGSPDLKPEVINTTELVFAWQPSTQWQTGLSIYRYEMRDIILLVTDPSGTKVARNAGKQRGTGFELEATWNAAKDLRFTGNYANQRSTDVTTNTDAGYAPRHHAYLRADWRFGVGCALDTQVNWVKDRKRAFGDARPAIPDYTTVDFTLRTLSARGKWDYSLSVRNALDKEVREPSLAPGLIPNDFPLARRSLYAQASYTF